MSKLHIFTMRAVFLFQPANLLPEILIRSIPIPYLGIVFVLFLSSSAFYSTLVLHSESVENKM